jgi:hypothetical protein
MSSEYQPVAGSPTPHYSDRREFRVDTGRLEYDYKNVPTCVPYSLAGNFVHRGRPVGCFPGHYGAYRDTDGTLRCVRADGPCAPTDVNRTFGCGKTVAELEAVTKAADDPTRVFHQTQTCIARKSCDLRCRMDNCKWLDRVIPDFVDPYLQKTGNWSALESVCQLVKLNYRSYGAPIVGDLLCAEAMAEYHIEVDLVAAMTATGCGSDNDWNLVYQQIQTCSGDTQTALLGGWPDAAKNAGADYAAWKVRKLRDNARAQCIANRTAAGLDPEMSAAEKGKVCLQP